MWISEQHSTARGIKRTIFLSLIFTVNNEFLTNLHIQSCIIWSMSLTFLTAYHIILLTDFHVITVLLFCTVTLFLKLTYDKIFHLLGGNSLLSVNSPHWTPGPSLLLLAW